MSYASRVAAALANYGKWKPTIPGDRAFNLGAVLGIDRADRGLDGNWIPPIAHDHTYEPRDVVPRDRINMTLVQNPKLRAEARRLLAATIVAQITATQNALLCAGSQISAIAGILLSSGLVFYATKSLTAMPQYLAVAAGVGGSLFSVVAGSSAVGKYETRKDLNRMYARAADRLAEDVEEYYRLPHLPDSLTDDMAAGRISNFLAIHKPLLDDMWNPERRRPLYKLCETLSIGVFVFRQVSHRLSREIGDGDLASYVTRRIESNKLDS